MDHKKNLEKKVDQDGLISLNEFETACQDACRLSDFWVHYDSRIGWKLGQFIEESFNKGIFLKARFDLLNIKSSADFEVPLRKAHFWGNKFDWKKVRQRELSYEARHGDLENMFYRLAGNPFTKFQWNFPSSEEIAILKIEEFSKDVSDKGNRTKFLHAIIDLPSLNISHCDGADIKYSADEYKSRYEGAEIKGSDYEKLFRFDGTMSKEYWLSLVAAFFDRNGFVMEYFTATQ